MHERSLVRAVIEQVQAECRDRRLQRLHEIRLQLGEFSGVEPRLIELAFEEMAPDFWDHEVRLIVDIVSLTAQCQECGLEFSVESFRFVCPSCDGRDVVVTGGEEMKIVSVQTERPACYQEVES